MGESVKKIVLYNAETGEQLELNGAAEISLADEYLNKEYNEVFFKALDREFVGQIESSDPMAGLRMILALETWVGKVPRVLIRDKAKWPWRM